MKTFKVWDKLNGDGDIYGEYILAEASDPGAAAVKYAERDVEGLGCGLYGEPHPICVLDGDRVREFGVVVDRRPRFSAVEICDEQDECELCGDTGWAAGNTGTSYGGLSEQIGVPCPRGCNPGEED